MINLSDMMGKAFGQQKLKRRKLQACPMRGTSWSKRNRKSGIDQDDVAARCAPPMPKPTGSCSLTRSTRSRCQRCAWRFGFSREGVQRDLLPLIEGTTVATKYGPMKTDHVLFIASGAFHVAKPIRHAARIAGPLADPGRAASADRRGFRPHPFSETRANLVEQYTRTDRARRDVTAGLHSRSRSREVARIAAQVNESVENIGARRLQTVMEKLLEEAELRGGRPRRRGAFTVDAEYVARASWPGWQATCGSCRNTSCKAEFRSGQCSNWTTRGRVNGMEHEGGCHCGAVRYRISVNGPPMHVALCHCSDCRKSSGAPMVALGGMLGRADQFAVTQGAGKNAQFIGRSRCAVSAPKCGSGLLVHQ